MTRTDDGARAGARTRVVATVVALLVVAAVLVLVAGALRPESDLPTGRDRVEAVLDDEPTAPVVLPVAPPAGYRLAFGDTASGGSGPPLTAWAFHPPTNRGDLAVVQLCVAAAQRCTGAPAQADVREVDGVEVVVVPLGDAAQSQATLDLWRGVELTTRWEELGWLDRAAAPREDEQSATAR